MGWPATWHKVMKLTLTFSSSLWFTQKLLPDCFYLLGQTKENKYDTPQHLLSWINVLSPIPNAKVTEIPKYYITRVVGHKNIALVSCPVIKEIRESAVGLSPAFIGFVGFGFFCKQLMKVFVQYTQHYWICKKRSKRNRGGK